jgi:hypothetical protein
MACLGNIDRKLMELFAAIRRAFSVCRGSQGLATNSV